MERTESSYIPDAIITANDYYFNFSECTYL